MKMTVEFEALIKQVATKSLVSMDKQVWLKLEFCNPSDELMDKINRLHKPDETVKVRIENVSQ